MADHRRSASAGGARPVGLFSCHRAPARPLASGGPAGLRRCCPTLWVAGGPQGGPACPPKLRPSSRFLPPTAARLTMDASPASARPGARTAAAGMHRSLQEPVLASAEDELEPAAQSTPAGSQAPESAQGAGPAQAQAIRLADGLRRWVSDRPGQAALAALGAGALLALLAGRRRQNRRPD